MDVIRHDHVATYCNVGGVLCALGKNTERSVDLIVCQALPSFMCAESNEVEGAWRKDVF